jgi:predicted MFS family arabinose efflux permease
MGAYTAFLDLSLGISGPLLGLIAGSASLNFVYLVSAIIVLFAAALTMWLWRRQHS